MMNSCHDENKNEIVWQPTELNYNWFSLSLHFQQNEQSIVQRRHILWKYRKNKQSNCKVHEKSSRNHLRLDHTTIVNSAN